MRKVKPFNYHLTPAFQASIGDRQFMRTAHRITDDSVDIVLHEVIGDPFEETTSSDVVRLLADHRDKPVNVSINSPGGFVFDGIGIYNALAEHPKPVTVDITGLAGSSASFIAMAGDTIRMASNARLMIHRAWAMAVGNTDLMEDMAGVLAGIDDDIARTYSARSGQPMDKVRDWMRGKVDGTWFSAQQAHELGFVDEVTGLKEAPGEAEAIAQREAKITDAARAAIEARARMVRVDLECQRLTAGAN